MFEMLQHFKSNVATLHWMLRLQSRIIETYPSLPWRDQAFRSNLRQAHGIVDAWLDESQTCLTLAWPGHHANKWT